MSTDDKGIKFYETEFGVLITDDNNDRVVDEMRRRNVPLDDLLADAEENCAMCERVHDEHGTYLFMTHFTEGKCQGWTAYKMPGARPDDPIVGRVLSGIDECIRDLAGGKVRMLLKNWR